MNVQDNSTGDAGSATLMSRRNFGVGVASFAGLALIATVAATASDVGIRMSALVEAHRAARRASDEINARYDALFASTEMPDGHVVMGVDHFSKQPCRWACSEYEIDQEVARLSPAAVGRAAMAARTAWGERKKTELRERMAERDRVYEASGLAALISEADEADGIEFAAWEALMKARPATMADCAVRAAYLLSITKDVDHPRLANWLDEFLGSMIEEAGHAA